MRTDTLRTASLWNSAQRIRPAGRLKPPRDAARSFPES